MDNLDWNDRYTAADLVWGAGPNAFVEEELGDVTPSGIALDLACGEGRNAIWLAQRGWEVVAVDFSDVAVGRGRRLAEERGVDVDFRVGDVTDAPSFPVHVTLGVIAYLQLPPGLMAAALRNTAAALATGGMLFMIGHARRNLTDGVGGPSTPEVLWDPAELAGILEDAGLTVERAEHVLRPVETEAGVRDAVDCLILARRP